MKLHRLLLLLALTFTAHSEEARDLIGGDFTGWDFVTKDGKQPPEAAWSLRDGVLSTTGTPEGYLRTKESYRDYTLKVEWRWLPGSGKNNSGVLLHISTPGAAGVWPKSFESQLMQGNAGDFWTIGETLEATGEQKGGRWIRIADPEEKPVGEWNTMTVESSEDSLVIHMNGVLVNRGKNLSATRGAIGLQAEGTAIEFRSVILTEAD